MADDVSYFNQCLWQYNDKQISNSFFTAEKFSVQDSWGISALKLKLSISQFKSGKGNWIHLSHQDVYLMIHKIKAIQANINSTIKEVNSDPQKQVNVPIKLKKNLIVTFLHRVEYGGCCVRIILSEKNKDYLDSEKVYLPTFDFMSLVMVLGEYMRTYVASSDNMMNAMLLKNIAQTTNNLNEKISGYYSECMQLYKAKSLLDAQQAALNGRMTYSASSEPFTPEELPVGNVPSPTMIMSPSTEQVIQMNEDDDIFGDATPPPASEPLVKSQPVESTTIPVDEEEEQKLRDLGLAAQKPDEPVVLVEETSVVDEALKEIPVDDELDDLQSAMDDFIKVETPNIDLGIHEETKVTPDISKTVIKQSSFTEDILKNDVTNLEMYVTNMVNDDLPFLKFCEVIKSKMGFDPVENVKQNEVNSVNYLISHYLKHSLKKCLEEQVDFPANVSPILFTDTNLSENSISLMYDLFIYFIYYTQLRNMLKEKDYNPMNNRDFMCFSFKTIASPLAITGFNQIDERTLLTEITNRYTRYRESGVFDKLRAEVKSRFSCEFDLPADAMKTEASRIYGAIKTNYDKLTVEYAFTKFSLLKLKLNYDDFKENSFQDEQIKKIVAIEFNYRKNGKTVYEEIEYKNFDDIPSSVLEKFDITEKKYDNTNLKRYIKELTKDDEETQKESLKIVNKINYSYRDLRSIKVDFTMLPVEILRAIFLWDVDRDEKITINYLHFREVVQKCSLTKDMIISLLTNIQDTIDVDFVNSFIAVRDE